MALDEATLAKVWGVLDDPQAPVDVKRKATAVLEKHGALAPRSEDGRAGQPKSFTASDEDLGISSPLAEDETRLPSGGEARQLGRKRAHTTTELEGDPIAQGIVGGAEGALVAAPVAGLVGVASPVAGKLVRGAVEGGAATAAQGGDLGDILKGAAIGTVLEGPGAARAALQGAESRAASRMQTDITGGAKGKAAKQVLAAKDILEETYAAHPELRKTMATGSTAEKANAVRGKIDELTEANDAATDAIAKHHGNISTDTIASRLRAIEERAKAAGDEVTRKAARKTLDTIDGLSEAERVPPEAPIGVDPELGPVSRVRVTGGSAGTPADPELVALGSSRGSSLSGQGANYVSLPTPEVPTRSVITAKQLRGIRNGLAAKIQTAAPGTAAFGDQAAAATAIKAELNEAISDLAEKTPGVDVEALKARNRQIAALMPVERQLFERAQAEGLAQPHNLTAEILEPHGARKLAAKKVRETAARADYALANSDAAQRLFGKTAADTLPASAARATAASSTATGDDLTYAAKVAQAMKAGMSLQDAVNAAR
jgi:hypothetical protein